jgi:SAM-dependent methyltransferase
MWVQLFENGRRAYEETPVGNLSVRGHPMAAAFRGFIAPYLSGNVLDVGCGPQPLPSYLEGHRHVREFAGCDPLPGGPDRELSFACTYAEFLPWKDEEFDVGIFATSLDHVLSLDLTLTEAHRVLVRGGHCIVWTGLTLDAAAYDPASPSVKPIDDFHMFHFSQSTLDAALSRLFVPKETLLFPGELFAVYSKP